MSEAIEFDCEVITVKVCRDYSIEVTLGLPEDCVPQLAMLAEAKREGIPLHATIGTKTEINGNGRQSKPLQSRKPRRARQTTEE